MYRRLINTTLAVLILSGFATQGLAFDSKRKGFILGGDLGTGLTSFTQTIEFIGYEETSDRENKLPIFTSFVIGGGLNNNVQLYYFNKVSWFSIENVFGDNVIIASGVGGLGVSYHFNPKAPSAFLAGGLGVSSWAAPLEEEADYWWGLGFMFGAGFEFSPHWSVEANFTLGNPKEEEMGLEASSNVFSVVLTCNVLAY